MDSINILIKAILEKGSEQQLKSELEKISKNMPSLDVKIGTDKITQFANATKEVYKVVTDTTNALGQQVAITEKLNAAGTALEIAGYKTVDNQKQKNKELEKTAELTEKIAQKEYVRGSTAKIKEIEDRNKALKEQLELDEKIAQKEYVKSNMSKINDVNLKNKELQIQLELDEKIAQKEYLKSNTAKIQEVELRNKELQKQLDLEEKISQQQYIRSMKAQMQQVDSRNKGEEQKYLTEQKATYQNALNGVSSKSDMKNASAQFAELEAKIKTSSGAIRAQQKDVMSLGDAFKQAFEKFPKMYGEIVA